MNVVWVVLYRNHRIRKAFQDGLKMFKSVQGAVTSH